MLQKPTKKHIFLALLILCSTLCWFVHVGGMPFYWVNAVYIALIAPYLIWRLLFQNGKNTLPRIALIAIPILLVAATLLVFDVMAVTVSFLKQFPALVYETPQTLIVMILNPYQILIRIILYGLMLFVWDDTFRKRFRFKVVVWLLILFFNVCMLCKLLLISALSAMVLYG